MVSDPKNKEISVSVEETPNPQTRRFVVCDATLCEDVADFPNAKAAQGIPLPEALFSVVGVDGVMMGKDFVSVTKSPHVDWDAVSEALGWQSLSEKICGVLKQELQSDHPQLTRTTQEEGEAVLGETAQKIKDVVDQEIRPAVAQDGGDVVFDRFEEGVVYVHLKGACSGCPNALITLKMGIENRLRQEFPDVKEVVSV